MTLARFDAAPDEEATAMLLACCDVPRWADAVREGRPYGDVDAALAVADAAARTFTPEEVDRALAAHPRIGERATGDSTEAAFSRREQSSVSTEADVQQALLEANRAYEERFDRIFLVCASGLSAEQVLTAARTRLANDDATEAAVVADELRRIALLRLRRTLDPQEQA
ncbi:2-oxo-4-hydroxy-4-carboxy-5-ureidoimidazoline decarboxylase [Nocardioides sp. CFH 31398]|uniref:2-oxo-4-hydroxy-4-carboxy-5-ureidoimidazoline decarboxylase n=1 Tax=Nocardioides sp. CFH 31398 TaxID=2919579 RepID=UPI001F062F94|nr:2-oxo-4-hydroxy-4-carboxy-5-ureidoimidazoline decarboxylase [Nocardioides sp. CFH 31398]MCH1867844.1 2-oxo-4-hydroxy-4-carboxy-5-ureidoimidazoline decarboxylase [Nocardioides sp. CFH 31398]